MNNSKSVITINDYGTISVHLKELMDNKNITRNYLAKATNTRFEVLPESVKLIIDCSEKPRDNALFYAFQVFKLFTHKVQLLLPIPPSPFPKGRGRLQGTAAGVLRTPAAWLK